MMMVEAKREKIIIRKKWLYKFTSYHILFKYFSFRENRNQMLLNRVCCCAMNETRWKISVTLECTWMDGCVYMFLFEKFINNDLGLPPMMMQSKICKWTFQIIHCWLNAPPPVQDQMPNTYMMMCKVSLFVHYLKVNFARWLFNGKK